ncbi:MAG: 30S ribosomal protein S6e [Candidatus Altiarchaeales archaeon ex4484_96]|nr:MAG: 30S ribosomal protein S6e [Candidatus Altiarchaeales archaeon ex4484_96]
MEYKITISNPKDGRSYQQEVKDEKAKRLNGMRIGESFDASFLGLTGYSLEITGGSDKSGFPLKKGVRGSAMVKVLLKGGSGYRPKGKIRKKKTVRGGRVDENTAQINTKVLKSGKKSIVDLLGVGKAEDSGEKTKEEKKE